MLFRDAIKAHMILQLGLTDEKEVEIVLARHYEPGQVYVIKVPGSEAREFLVSRPVISPCSLASRSTRGYGAVDVQTEKVVFLKDSWRPDISEVHIEGLTLQYLRASGVEAEVPIVVCQGDVAVALTSKYSKSFGIGHQRHSTL
ncbi:uncharacterized protein BT62DRAFT_605307 [Guyanagaster necrorhizus]|uniref:Uncharacterized protein n=1 Tax=Guyanagaster necrorhizus TaxID=856835 RepID=A0A9P8AVN3_9AGAR|nr:uncharacterized protein BT62DRAFT_605307 [Guyanagaster necrorhizus MCA 3950]KAG7449749.1 hypothetical protein BT62DRAFT_605307 [Guyanagaster necrorhizus MCA 3950]